MVTQILRLQFGPLPVAHRHGRAGHRQNLSRQVRLRVQRQAIHARHTSGARSARRSFGEVLVLPTDGGDTGGSGNKRSTGGSRRDEAMGKLARGLRAIEVSIALSAVQITEAAADE